MKTLEHPLTLRVLHETYQISAVNGDTADWHEVVTYLERQLHHMGQTSGETNANRLLLRTTLELAAKLLNLHKHQQTALAQTQGQLDRLRQLVDTRFDLLTYSSNWLEKRQSPVNPGPDATGPAPLKSRRSFHHN